MKKLLSIVLTAIMAVTVFTASVVPAFAADFLSPSATTAKEKGPITTVNGATNTTDITYTPDSTDSNKITFTYTGDGTLIGWDTNLDALGFVEGQDYTITENKDGTLTIEFVSPDAIEALESGEVSVDAQVKLAATTAAASKKNDSSKSPATGAVSAVVAGSVAVACAGVAVLSATKKKDAE